jgi:hypothetical protein
MYTERVVYLPLMFLLEMLFELLRCGNVES